MQRRFSMGEFGLLMLPVLAIGALGLWISSRPAPVIDDGKPRLQFRVEAATGIEASRGFDGAFVVEAKDRQGQNYTMAPGKPYLELETPRGMQVSRLIRGKTTGFGRGFWGNNVHNSRFTFRAGRLPPGTLRFGFDAVAFRGRVAMGVTPLPPTRLSAKWQVDRTKVQPLDRAAMRRKPLLQMRSVTINRITPIGGPRSPGLITGDIVFDLQGAAMNEKTPLECTFLEHQMVPGTLRRSGVAYSRRPSKAPAPPQPRTRVVKWFSYVQTPTDAFQLTGRASADNRWPLGFEIEPFGFKTAKVGQKLKFKQFPVVLPQP